MKRNQFIRQVVGMTVIGIPAISLLESCAKEDEPTPPTPDPTDCLANGTRTTITANHGHKLTVSAVDVENGVEKTYTIQGSSAHPHSVTITAAMFSTLKASKEINVGSTNNSGHTHSVNVTCA